MEIDDAVVREIVRRVLGVARPQRIILFGAAAAGRMTADSDIDLPVLEASPSNARAESVRIRDALRGLGYPFDVIVMAAGRFEATRNVVVGIAYPANKYGRTIYEAA